MGYGSYSLSDRSTRSMKLGYDTKSRDDIFTQSKVGKAHESMNPKGVKIRECRDSADHPDATPIQLYLDVTGSMGDIPHIMVKNGLPTLMGTLTQRGVKDAALMFGAIGDHECDRSPLQVGQFESGDAELDMWLTRTWIEGNGGGNAGESYLLAWYFAANHVATDAWDKRKKKGFLFTIGDEPTLKHIPAKAIQEIMGDTAVAQGTLRVEELLAAASVKNHVFHIHVNHGGRYLDSAWKQMLGDHLIEVSDHNDIPMVIAQTILKIQGKSGSSDANIVINEPTTQKPNTLVDDSGTPHIVL